MTASSIPQILMIDDDHDLRRIYARYLSAEGFEVSEAGSTAEALQSFPGKKFEVILLDIRIQESDGSQFLPVLRQRYPHTPVIVFSCHSVEIQKEMVGKAADYFDKSSGCRALLSKIRTLLSIPVPQGEANLT